MLVSSARAGGADATPESNQPVARIMVNTALIYALLGIAARQAVLCPIPVIREGVAGRYAGARVRPVERVNIGVAHVDTRSVERAGHSSASIERHGDSICGQLGYQHAETRT